VRKWERGLHLKNIRMTPKYKNQKSKQTQKCDMRIIV